MSGLEVAGVVLGSLPLVISALENYAQGIATAKRYWRYKSELRSFILQINTERGIFVNTLEQLLGGIVRIEHMSDFLSNPGGEAWKDARVDLELKKRLRGAYEVYLGNVRGMQQSLSKMMVKLALGSDGKPQFTDPNLFKQEYKRLKFSLSKSEYSEQLGDLRNHNQALTRLTKQSLELEPARTNAQVRACPNFNALQQYARSLFHTLKSSLCCDCESHAVKLRLENRCGRINDEEEDLLKSTHFRVIFTNSSAANAPTRAWREADIRWIAEKPQCALLSSSTNASYSIAKATRTVRFGHVKTQAMIGNTTVTVTEQQGTVATEAGPVHIANLCQTIARLQSRRRVVCAGYMVDSLKRKHGIYPLDAPVCPTGQQDWTAYTLRQVLTRRAGSVGRFTQHDKYKVAVDLASSVLQLYKTPWLSDDWTDNDVYFVHRPGAVSSILYEHAFIYRKFSSTVSPTLATQPPNQRVIRNQTLFSLGVTLIEVLYGKPIEELQTANDLDCEHTPGAVWCTAERLINEEEIYLEAGQLYSDAVRRCIRCDFNQKKTSLDDDEFQRAVYEGVVAPLEKMLQRFRGEF
ncbi:hypothetical protein BDU57DRAFT_194788 [Ampelomyces quisqualis]|uniref:DUF7580 domain-containing protein n=1 Tax=Ampelomyces quisqualis TaxID=50730 RepID=A0A6A5QSF7_AMPQU|nr:hypothetical protein BDU57DRAFT_194788 [Ampelomyces quisqualis]